MQNLEQIRARNALSIGPISGDQGGEVIKKVAPLILNHGLLATAAYSFTEKEGWQKVFDAIARHLADPDIAIIPTDYTDREKLMQFLSDKTTTSETLKLATAETMAWLTYACRFVKKG
jgi:hypothetical protein